MAPRKAAASVGAAAPAQPALRRSARLNAAPAVSLPTPATKKKRVTKTKAAPKPKSVRKECSTCSRKLAASSYPREPPTESCKHEITTCNSCTKIHITYQLESVTYDNISCPECPQILQSADVKRLGDKKAYERYDELERKGIAEKTPGWRWCLNPECRAGQVHQPLVTDHTAASEAAEQEVEVKQKTCASKRKAYIARKKTNATDEEEDSLSNDICTCHECGARACVTCDRPYHVGETCAQFQKRYRRQTENEIQASEKAIEKNCRKCPNEKCGKNIEKDGGCDSMYCTQCKTQFCWQCGLKYVDINRTGHGEGCVYAERGAFDPHAAPHAPQNAVFNVQLANPHAQPRIIAPPPMPMVPVAVPPGMGWALVGGLGALVQHFRRPAGHARGPGGNGRGGVGA